MLVPIANKTWSLSGNAPVPTGKVRATSRAHTDSGILPARYGFSLLEVILALALSVVIVSAIGYSVHLYMLTLTRQQSDIERKQVARSIVMMIHNDLRGAIQYKPQDYSGLENLYESLVPDVLAMAMGGEEEESEEEKEEASGEDESSAEEDMSTSRPTMIGNSGAIVIDVSRLPRVDEYNPLIALASTLLALTSLDQRHLPEAAATRGKRVLSAKRQPVAP